MVGSDGDTTHPAAFLPEGVRVVKCGKFDGKSFGESAYTLYEAGCPQQPKEAPCLLVWLHGQDMCHIPPCDIKTIQRRLGRRMFCCAPRNPEPSWSSKRFLWACGYTKSQNKGGLGFVFGQLDTEYLDALTAVIREIKCEVGASHVIAAGYSMGGFGAYQLGGHAPDVYDVVVSIAGHGLGTLEPQGNGYRAPQPESSKIFQGFLAQYAPNLATIPLVLAVHAQRDTVCCFDDTLAIVSSVQQHEGSAEVAVVPDDMADSDLRKTKKRHGHSYYNYALLQDTSEELIYTWIRTVLSVAPRAVRQKAIVPDVPLQPPHESGDQNADLGSKPPSTLPSKAVATASRDDLVAEAKRRLQLFKSAATHAQIQKVKDLYDLSDEVELALRMLPHTKLRELLSTANGKLAGAPDRSKAMRDLIAAFDMDVEMLVRGLLEVDAPAENSIRSGAVAAKHSDVGVLAQAKARLQANKDEANARAIQSFVEDCSFGNGIELALRMLAPEHLMEILYEADAIKRRLSTVEDAEASMRWMISQLDPEVDDLVSRLMELDNEGSTQQPEGSEQSRLPVHAQTAEHLQDGEQEADLRTGASRSRSRSRSKTRRITPAATSGAGEAVGTDAVAEVKRRLRLNKGTPNETAVQALRVDCDFGDEAELAMRMLKPDALKRVLQKANLRAELAAAADMSRYILDLVSQFDPAVETLVCRCKEMDSTNSGA